jgi:hypothetical protein
VIQEWIREEVSVNTCFDTAAKVREKAVFSERTDVLFLFGAGLLA